MPNQNSEISPRQINQALKVAQQSPQYKPISPRKLKQAHEREAKLEVLKLKQAKLIAQRELTKREKERQEKDAKAINFETHGDHETVIDARSSARNLSTHMGNH